jgi:hypothetical protein
MNIFDLCFSNQVLQIEREQLFDEGRDINDAVQEEFKTLDGMNLLEDPSAQMRVQVFQDLVSGLSFRVDYPYEEPSDLEGIRVARPHGSRKYENALSSEDLYDRIYGAWLGRCSGCLLGKPVEGWRSGIMWPYLKDLGKYPLSSYFRSDEPDAVVEKYHINRNRAYVDRVARMVEDDDTNYTVTGLAVFDKHGPDFSSENVGLFWLGHLPLLHTYTAERVAYRNLTNLIPPPNSASYRNPFREWIGAQIRADFWGYVALGNPSLAAEFAWRDASVSHVKNGIYGEMWVAAMLASAPFEKTTRAVIEAGLREIPKNSRLTENIHEVFAWHEKGLSFEEAIGEVHQKWDETNPHHWVHTISNAQIVAIGLLWGEEDFEKSICRAVQACFDTDCNGATVGSIYGMMHGAQALPAKWISPLNDGLETGIAGYHLVKISDMARKTVEFHSTVRERLQ